MIKKVLYSAGIRGEKSVHMENSHDRINLRWKFFAFGIIALLCLTLRLLPGNGVQARLDLSDGLRSERFYASRMDASALLTDQQRSVLAWAILKLDKEKAHDIYGKHPTVRTLVMGEILRTADLYRDNMREQEAKLGAMDPNAVQASRDAFVVRQQKRLDELKLFDTYAPTIVGVEKERISDRSYAVVKYHLQLPDDLVLRFLPCALAYSDKDLILKGKLEFDCLFMPASGNEYRARILLPEDFDVARLQLKLSVEFGRAIVERRADRFAAIDPIEESIPELAAQRLMQKQMKDALDQKVYF
jgi:hypothetical protein